MIEEAWKKFVSGVRSGIPLKESDYKYILDADDEMKRQLFEIRTKDSMIEEMAEENKRLREAMEWVIEYANADGGMDVFKRELRHRAGIE